MAVSIIGWPDKPLYLGIAAIVQSASSFLAHKRRVGRQNKQPVRLGIQLFYPKQDGVKHLSLAEMPVCRNCDPIVLKVLLDNTVLITDYNCDLVYGYGFEHLNLIGQHAFSADMNKRLRSFYIRGLPCCQYCCGFHPFPSPFLSHAKKSEQACLLAPTWHPRRDSNSLPCA